MKAIVNRLLHERVIRHFALANEIFGARDLIGEHRRDQILGAHPLQRRGHFLAAAETRQGERRRRNPAPPRREHRCVEQRLDQDRAHARAMQIMRDVLERKAVARRQRNHDRVFGRRRLKLKIEFAAKALAQRQSPRAIDPTAVRRMNDELRAARLVEKTLEHDRALRREHAQRRTRGCEIVDHLLRRRRCHPDRRDHARGRRCIRLVEIFAKPRHRL